MEKPTIILTFLLFILIISCKEDDIEYIESLAGVKEISAPDSVKINDQFSITLTIFGSSGCSQFSRFEMTSTSDTLDFTIYEKREKNIGCSGQIIEIEAVIAIRLKNEGKHYLKFNEGSAFVLTDSIIVIK